MSESTSASHVKEFAASRGIEIPTDEQAEEISSIQRAALVESIRVLEAGGAVWDAKTQTYMFRSDFPAE